MRCCGCKFRDELLWRFEVVWLCSREAGELTRPPQIIMDLGAMMLNPLLRTATTESTNKRGRGWALRAVSEKMSGNLLVLSQCMEASACTLRLLRGCRNLFGRRGGGERGYPMLCNLATTMTRLCAIHDGFYFAVDSVEGRISDVRGCGLTFSWE